MALTRRQRSLKAWSRQKWRTKSGKKSSVTGERYLPSAAIKALSPAEYAATTREKREAKRQGKHLVSNPKGLLLKLNADDLANQFYKFIITIRANKIARME